MKGWKQQLNQDETGSLSTIMVRVLSSIDQKIFPEVMDWFNHMPPEHQRDIFRHCNRNINQMVTWIKADVYIDEVVRPVAFIWAAHHTREEIVAIYEEYALPAEFGLRVVTDVQAIEAFAA